MVRMISFLLGLFEASTIRLSLSFSMIGMDRACGRMWFGIAVWGDCRVSVSRDMRNTYKLLQCPLLSCRQIPYFCRFGTQGTSW